MKKNNIIAVLGGDLRQYRAAQVLERNKWKINLWGLDISEDGAEDMNHYESFSSALEDCFAVLLPLPVTVDGIHLNTPFNNSGEKLRLFEILDVAQRDTIIIGGRLPESFVVKAQSKGIVTYDYFLSEDFQIKNAYITAEAAVSIAMNSLNKNICGARVAITGYGRIAKHLTRLLTGLGANVTVVARKLSDLAWSHSCGCTALRIGDSDELKNNIYQLTEGYDIIYNTVPSWLFDRNFLERVDKKTFIIDLASAPGGVDIRAAKELHANVLWATSLPGKYAPVSAGDIIASCVDGFLGKEVDR